MQQIFTRVRKSEASATAAPGARWLGMSQLIVNAVGTAAALCSMASFIPQVIKLIKEKDASQVSLRMYLVTVAGFSLWLTYGFLLKSWPLIASNAVSLALSAAILGLKLRYPDAKAAEAAQAASA